MTAHQPDFAARAKAEAARFKGLPRYHFVGGNNDAEALPVDALAAAAAEAVAEEGRGLAMYFSGGSPLGHAGLRGFIAQALQDRAGLDADPEEILMVSGSLQALDLVNGALLEPGDRVLTELETYGGALSRIRAFGAEPVGVATDDDGMNPQSLRAALAAGPKPKYLYLIPTVQNPTGTIMSEARRREILAIAAEHDLTIFEDDCYADLVFTGRKRPPAFRALDDSGRVIYCASFSKNIAPGLRVGFVTADWPILSRLLPLKTDAGSGMVEQAMLARFAPAAFDGHVDRLIEALKAKADAMMEAVDREFGAVAEYRRPDGGIFLWVTLPDSVDTSKLAQAAAAEGVAINPGAEWCADAEHGRHRLRLCFANPSKQDIDEGVAVLAEVCRREFGLPERSANVAAS
ncbi:MAG: PLP-dependent aminotransferase family protein [Pseudomonadota bacterium]